MIQLNLVKKIFPFFLLIFLLNTGVLALDFELASNYEKIKAAIVHNNSQKLFDIQTEIGIIPPASKSKLTKTQLSELFRKVGIDERALDFLKTTNLDNNSLGYLVGFLFYPYNNLNNTTATNFTQLPKALKTSILISAQYGFKPARDLLVLTTLGKAKVRSLTFSSEDELVSFLSIPFCCEDIGVIEAARILLEEGNGRNVASFISKCRDSQNPITLLNSARLLKILGVNVKIFEILNHAIALGSKRALIEKGFLLIEQDFLAAKEFFESEEITRHGLGAYGLWKIAQCYRYGIGIKRNLTEANNFYLKAINTPKTDFSQQLFPEIYYDAGKFATYYALSQSDMSKKFSALRQASLYFKTAGYFGMVPAFSRASETERRLEELNISESALDSFQRERRSITLVPTKKFSVLSLNNNTSRIEKISEIASNAARVGLFDEASRIAKRYNIPIPKGNDVDAFMWAQAEQLKQNYEKIEDKVRTW